MYSGREPMLDLSLLRAFVLSPVDSNVEAKARVRDFSILQSANKRQTKMSELKDMLNSVKIARTINGCQKALLPQKRYSRL